MVTTAPAPAPTPAPPTSTTITPPGYETLSGWVALLVVVLGALPTTIFANSSPATLQIVGLIVSAVTAILTHTNVTSLARARIAHATALAVAGRDKGFVKLHVMPVLVAIGLVLGAVLLAPACGSTAGQVALKAGECVLDSGVLQTVLQDLASDNFANLINPSDPLVACALTAVASGSATAPSDAGSAAPDIRVARARQLLAKK